jgi:hypothetical protein
MLSRIRWCAACYAALAWSQAPPDPEHLAKIKAAVQANLDRLPNYTCTETIHQSQTPKSIGRAVLLETTRLEVAYVEGQELFGWPGAAKIDQPDIGKMISGSTGNGYFGILSDNVFSGPTTTFQYAGAAALDGKDALRWDYVVPKLSQAYHIKTESGEAMVGFHGSFWVNAGALDLIRITAIIDDPPIAIGVAATSSILDFERQTIGGSSFVLPRSAELVVLDTDAVESRSRLSFSACHQFVGESVLKFDDPTPEASRAAAKTPATVIALPDDFTVDFNLDSPIDTATAASGDPVHATLRDHVRENGRIVVPKGAGLSGRIAHLAMRGDLYYLEFAFASIDFEGGHADLAGRRNGVSKKDTPLIFNSPKIKLASGARLTLHSRLLKSVHNDSIRP